jgi:hypothetical protein
VYGSSWVTESLLRERFEASIAPEVVANPPLRAPKDLEGFKRLDFLLDPRLPALNNPTLVLWGNGGARPGPEGRRGHPVGPGGP